MKILESALDLIFPPVCGFCGKVNNGYICKECLNIVNSLAVNKQESINNHFFNEYLYIFKYEEIIREKILEFKFESKSYLYRTFAEAILNNKKNIEFIKKYDFLVPVPIHKIRKRKRGYNQSELIARAISNEIKNIKLKTNIIIKEKNIVAQSTLNKKQREANIQNSFKVINSNIIKNNKILLLDDILTTGSTANECSKVLLEAGCKEVGLITIAKD